MCGDAGAKEVDDIKLTATSVFATNGTSCGRLQRFCHGSRTELEMRRAAACSQRRPRSGLKQADRPGPPVTREGSRHGRIGNYCEVPTFGLVTNCS